jgi:FKBP-type peptidyl-prolyl cis-trans isomerase FkpA
MKLWHIGCIGGVIALAFCGCEDPGVIIPTTPPGANIPRESPDIEPAQAQGEMAGANAKAPDKAELARKYPLAPATAKGQKKKTKGGVEYETITEGKGPELQAGQKASIHYEGSLGNGTIFDSTKAKQPRLFQIGVDQLILGWTEAIPGMRVGEVRKLVIPPELAYGASGRAPVIPPNATLNFEIELVSILPDT